MERVPPNYAAFLSGLLSVCCPRILSLEGWNNTNNFFQWLYNKLRKRDAKCCSSHSIKCWRHDLKDCKIDGFTSYGDADDADIDDSMIMLLKIPPGVLKFHLDGDFFYLLRRPSIFAFLKKQHISLHAV